MTTESKERALLAMRVAKLRKLGQELQAWIAADCPVGDEQDTYPSDLWQAATRPESLLPLLDALLSSPSAAPAGVEAPRVLPETMNRDEMLKHYSAHANLLAHEALQYQKRIRELEAALASPPPAPAAAQEDAAMLDWLEKNGRMSYADSRGRVIYEVAFGNGGTTLRDAIRAAMKDSK